MNEQPFEYRTGQTTPPKSSRGLIAFLLILVIFLSGVVSVLGLMNVKLFRLLEQKNTESPLSFAEGDVTPNTEGDTLTLGGITVQELPDLYGQLYDLPEGLYVVDAPEDSPVAPGDVLLSVNGTAVSKLDTLQTLLTQMDGYLLELTVFQNGTENTLTFTTLDQ